MLGMPTEQPLYLTVRQEFVFSLGVVADDTCKILFAAFNVFTDSVSGMSKRTHVISVGMFTSERARTHLD